MGKKIPNIPELLGKLPEYQKRAELHDQITVKILELVDEIYKIVDETNQRLADVERYIMEREIKE